MFKFVKYDKKSFSINIYKNDMLYGYHGNKYGQKNFY